ncbi:MAG: hypothetical protein AAFP68_18500 [Pseudomonadota bacterium]
MAFPQTSVISLMLPATLAGAFAMATPAHAAGPKPQIRPVEHMATETTPAREIAGAKAMLTTTEAGASMTLSTSGLEPGHVTTAWWVVINKPMLCEAIPCSAEDVIGRADIVETQIVYADGVVNDANGNARFAAYLPQGQVENGWYPTGFDSPTEAEIHLVLNDHGRLLPEIAASMLTSYRGGCSDGSLPPPFPASAKADGVPGPNACLLIQDAIFQQDGQTTH